MRDVFGREPQPFAGAGLSRRTATARESSVEPFTLPGVGRGCYLTDPAGLLIGLHEYDPLRDLSRSIRHIR